MQDGCEINENGGNQNSQRSDFIKQRLLDWKRDDSEQLQSWTRQNDSRVAHQNVHVLLSLLLTWQSTSSSHTQLLGMQDEFPHWNSLGPQDDGAHSTSSVRSPHSSSPLHTKFLEMQRPLAHVNSFVAQVMLPRRRSHSWRLRNTHFIFQLQLKPSERPNSHFAKFSVSEDSRLVSPVQCTN